MLLVTVPYISINTIEVSCTEKRNQDLSRGRITRTDIEYDIREELFSESQEKLFIDDVNSTIAQAHYYYFDIDIAYGQLPTLPWTDACKNASLDASDDLCENEGIE